jgi:tetratricopeptide (TPR) repeat protein
MIQNGVVNFDVLKMLKAACARLESPIGVGTGYLVDDRHVATCEHVVQNLAPGAAVKARFGDDLGALSVVTKVLRVDKATDSALLELAAPLLGVVPLPLAEWSPPRADWMAYGFPAFADKMGVVLSGALMDPNAAVPGNMRGMAMYSPMLGAHPPKSVGGFSGSPVLIDGSIVGHLSSVLGVDGALQQPHLGYTYTAPIRGVLALLGRSVATSGALQSLTPQADIARLSGAFNTLQFAASGDEVKRVLGEAEASGMLTPELRHYAAQVLIGLALPEQALLVLKGAPGERAQELSGLAHSLLGDHAKAHGIVHNLSRTAEARGIEGGILKRRWLATRNQSFLRSAWTTYWEAYVEHRDHYPGINAAACALYLGNVDQSRSVATEIIQLLNGKKSRDQWEEASLAEAYLLMGNIEQASLHYGAAIDADASRTRDIAVMRAQARRNLKYLQRAVDALSKVFPPARRAAAFTGHRVGSKLPPDRVDSVRDRILDVLADQEVQFGFCSAASGSDLLFIEALISRSAEVEIFLPYARADFRRVSVGPDATWQRRFDKALDTVGPDRIVELPNAVASDDDPSAYVKCNDAIREAARRTSKMLGEPPFLLAVIAADAERHEVARGGAADAIHAWVDSGERDVIRVDPLA